MELYSIKILILNNRFDRIRGKLGKKACPKTRTDRWDPNITELL